MEEFPGLVVRPCYEPGTGKPQARALMSSAPQEPSKHPIRQLEMVTVPPFARYPWVLPPSHFCLLWSEYKCPCCQRPPRNRSHQPSKHRHQGSRLELSSGVWPWTLFGNVRCHQLPDSWNPAPFQLLEPRTNMAPCISVLPSIQQWSESTHRQLVPWKGQYTCPDL